VWILEGEGEEVNETEGSRREGKGKSGGKIYLPCLDLK